MTIEIGRLAVKTAGRDAGRKCIIIEILNDKYVLIDGQTRRRRCNILHLEPLSQVLKIEKNATHGDVLRALKEVGIDGMQTKPKPKTQKPKRKRKTPEQLREQKEEKKRIRDLFKPKIKEEKVEEKKEVTLEEKAGLAEEKKGETKEAKGQEKAETKLEKPKEKKSTPKKTKKKE